MELDLGIELQQSLKHDTLLFSWLLFFPDNLMNFKYRTLGI